MKSRTSSKFALAVSFCLCQLPGVAATSETDRQFKSDGENAAAVSTTESQSGLKAIQQLPSSSVDNPSGTAKSSASSQQSNADTSTKTKPKQGGLSQSQKAAAPFPVAGKFSRSVQRYTGMNLVGTLIANEAASLIASKKLGSHVKVRVKIFSVTDLLAGKVKAVSVSTAHGSVKGIPIGTAKLSTNGPVWFNFKHNTQQAYGLANPVVLNLSGSLRQKDVCKALESETVAKSMRGLKLDLPGLGDQQLKMVSPKVDLAEGSIKIKTTLIVDGAEPDTGVDLSIKAKPVLVGSKVLLEDMEVYSPDIPDPASFSKFMQDLFNPVVDFARFDRATHSFRPTKCSVEGDAVSISGGLLLVPNGFIAQAGKVPPATSDGAGKSAPTHSQP